MEKGLVVSLSFNFAVKVIGLYKKLITEKEFILSKQLLRCATSIGANIEEAQAASSKKDFINKIAIAAKEARETRYWLKLFQRTNLCNLDYSSYLSDIESLINILTKILTTAKQNLASSP